MTNIEALAGPEGAPTITPNVKEPGPDPACLG
jgi:hypothetical protein